MMTEHEKLYYFITKLLSRPNIPRFYRNTVWEYYSRDYFSSTESNIQRTEEGLND